MTRFVKTVSVLPRGFSLGEGQVLSRLKEHCSCIVVVTDHGCIEYGGIVGHARLVIDTLKVTKGIRRGREKVVKL